MGKNPIEHKLLFDKGWILLSSYQKQQVLDTINLFQEDPNHPSLRAHIPRGYDPSTLSITADEDLRILLRTRTNGSILLLDVGSHERVYGG